MVKAKREIEGVVSTCDGVRCSDWACEFVVSPGTSVADPPNAIYRQ